MQDKKYFIAFSLVPSIGSVKFTKLQGYFNTLKQAWQAPFGELVKAGLDEKTAQEIMAVRQQVDLEAELEKLAKREISVVTLGDADYPVLLKEIYNPPFLLYYKGKLKDERDEFSLSVVGTRKISAYGRQVAADLVAGLVQHQLAIVSGLALGVDTLAHQTCLQQGGRTIAVLGSGLSRRVIYPRHNLALFDKIIESGGLVLSEYPLDTQPQKYFFPQRNRIVSGLSRGTLVVEAPVKSGALLTARLAVEQNREVFAVPGNIYSANTAGPNNLLKLGAKAVTEVEDILSALNLQHSQTYVAAKKIVADTREEALILDHLSSEPVHIDELVHLTQLDTARINSTLTLMEMKGKVRNLGAMMYVLAR